MEECERCGGSLVGREPCPFCMAADEMLASGEVNAATVERIMASSRADNRVIAAEMAQMTDEERTAQAAEYERQRWELPATVTPLGSQLEFPCTAFGEGEEFTHMQLRITDEGIFCLDPRSQVVIFRRPWSHVVALETEGPETAERRVTATRLVAFGALALAAKKRSPKSYVVVETIGGDVQYFRVSRDLFELRAHLAPRTGWLKRHSATLRAA